MVWDPRIVVDLRTMSDDALATINRERLLAWLRGARSRCSP